MLSKILTKVYVATHIANSKQLLNEIEYDIEIYHGRGLCYPPKPKGEVENNNRGVDKYRNHTKTEFHNGFITYLKDESN